MPPFLDKLIRCHREFLGNLSRPVPFQVLLLILRYSSVTQSCPTLCYPMDCSNARFPYPAPTPRACSNSMSIESVMPSNHLILCRPLLPPSIFPSIKVFSIESVLHIRWPKYWSFSFSICPSSEYSGLISFRINWFDLLGVQGTLKSLLRMYGLNIHPSPWGFPGADSNRESTCQCSRCKRCRFDL